MRPAPRVIPLGGNDEAIAARDYAQLQIEGRSQSISFTFEKMLASDRAELTAYHQTRTGNGIRSRRCIAKIDAIARRNFLLTYYYKSLEFDFNNAAKFLLHRGLQTHRFLVKKEAILQRLFNITRLPAEKRMRALRIAVRSFTETGVAEFSPVKLIRGNIRRVARHPSHANLMRQNCFILDSFIESGEIQKLDFYRYKVMPKALATLDNYALEKRRHATLKTLQFIGVVVAAGQLLNVTPGTALDRANAFVATQFVNLWAMAQPVLFYLNSPWRPEDWVMVAAQYLERFF
ncbi:hypothetical protein QWC_17132 [Achromobacter marplatensis]|nr:hypothetical protein QWC_17132 [Achromobacter marplatensis]